MNERKSNFTHRIFNQSKCKQYELYNYEEGSELCGGQVLEPRMFIQVKYYQRKKIFVNNGYKFMDKNSHIGGADACQVLVSQLLKLFICYNFRVTQEDLLSDTLLLVVKARLPSEHISLVK